MWKFVEKLSLWATTFEQGWKNCILCMERNILGKKLFWKKTQTNELFWNLSEKFLDFGRKIFDRFVKTVFWVSRWIFWALFRKIVNMFTPNWQTAEKKINLLGKKPWDAFEPWKQFFEKKVVISTPKLENLVITFTPEKCSTIAQKNVICC